MGRSGTVCRSSPVSFIGGWTSYFMGTSATCNHGWQWHMLKTEPPGRLFYQWQLVSHTKKRLVGLSLRWWSNLNLVHAQPPKLEFYCGVYSFQVFLENQRHSQSVVTSKIEQFATETMAHLCTSMFYQVFPWPISARIWITRGLFTNHHLEVS